MTLTHPALQNKNALVTGVSRQAGIGAAIALALAQAGANIFITYYRPYDAAMPWGSRSDEAKQILTEIRRLGVQAAGQEANLADPLAPEQIFALAEDSLGPIDILVNNATHDVAADIYALTPELLDTHYALNVRGMLLLCREFARRHDGRPGGRIINLTSGQGLSPMPDSLAYAATKGAVEAAAISLSASLAPKGITVNAVDPGPTDTGWLSEELAAALIAQAPFGRLGQPEDAARLIAFLASPDAGWITGQIIRSRGGF